MAIERKEARGRTVLMYRYPVQAAQCGLGFFYIQPARLAEARHLQMFLAKLMCKVGQNQRQLLKSTDLYSSKIHVLSKESQA